MYGVFVEELKLLANVSSSLWVYCEKNTSGTNSDSTITSDFAFSADFKNELKKALDDDEDDASKIEELSLEALPSPVSCKDLLDRTINGSGTIGGNTSTTSDSDLSLQAQFNRRRCESTSAESEPYFVLIGVSFWEPVRFPVFNCRWPRRRCATNVGSNDMQR